MLKVCIIGSGMMGGFHAAAWRARGDAQIVAVCDLIEERRGKFAAAHGAAAYEDYRKALDHPGIQIVSVCTPVSFHAEMACLAACKGCHVLVEKPIALTLEQADEMIRAAEENKVLLSVSFQYRAWSRCVKYRDLVRGGEFGGPVFFRYADIREVRPKLAMHERSMNGGPLIDMAGHYFDLVRYFTGEEPERIFAARARVWPGKTAAGGGEGFCDRCGESGSGLRRRACARGVYQLGHAGGFSGHWRRDADRAGVCVRPAKEGIEMMRGAKKEIGTLGEDPKGPAIRIDGLVRAMRGETPLEVTGRDGRIALQCSLAALQSIESGEAVVIQGGRSN